MRPGPDPRTDVELLAGIQAGDRAAFAAFMTRHLDHVRALAGRIVSGSAAARGAAADDIAQDVFIDVWRRAGDFDADRGSARAWLAAMTTSRALDGLRRVKTLLTRFSTAPPEDMATSDPHPSIDEVLVQKSELDAAARALETLSPTARAALLLTALHGYRTADVAQILGRSPGATDALIARARRRLRRACAASEAPSATKPTRMRKALP